MKRLLPILLFVAGLGLWTLLRPEPPVAEIPPPAGPQAERALAALLDIQWRDLAGKPNRLGTAAGRVRVINFWATWCVPCRTEMPAFSRVSTKFTGKGVEFFGIGIDSADKIIEFNSKTPVSYMLLVGRQEDFELTSLLGNGPLGIPFTLVLDRAGRVNSVQVGRLSEAELERRIARALGAGTPAG
ncbi:MAG: TlpA family protein disulfide reductase [Rhodocyclaceae bacterium]|nr:TlpA family protein disulfide reductase [Rhodocyclaceae bacterium]